jgi:hypothetical protein
MRRHYPQGNQNVMEEGAMGKWKQKAATTTASITKDKRPKSRNTKRRHRVGGTAMARPNRRKTGGQTSSEESGTRKMDNKAENMADSRAREVGHGGKGTMEDSNEALESLETRYKNY